MALQLRVAQLHATHRPGLHSNTSGSPLAFRMATISYPIIGLVGIWIGERLETSIAIAFCGVFVMIDYLRWRNTKSNAEGE